MNDLRKSASNIEAKMANFHELYQIQDSLNDTKKEVKVVVNRRKAAEYGLNSNQIMSQLHSMLATTTMSNVIKFNNNSYGIQIGLRRSDINSLDKINIPLKVKRCDWIK